MKDILTIFKKELRRFLTDKRMLVTLLLPGVLIFCIYSLMGTSFESAIAGGTDADTQYVVYIDRAPSAFAEFDEGCWTYRMTAYKYNGLT